MIMAPRETPIPMPTLADLERPDEDAGIEVGLVVVELTAMLVEPRDADAVDAVAAVDDVDEVNAVNIEDVEDMIEACPSVTRFSESLQQLSWPILP